MIFFNSLPLWFVPLLLTTPTYSGSSHIAEIHAFGDTFENSADWIQAIGCDVVILGSLGHWSDYLIAIDITLNLGWDKIPQDWSSVKNLIYMIFSPDFETIDIGFGCFQIFLEDREGSYWGAESVIRKWAPLHADFGDRRSSYSYFKMKIQEATGWKLMMPQSENSFSSKFLISVCCSTLQAE